MAADTPPQSRCEIKTSENNRYVARKLVTGDLKGRVVAARAPTQTSAQAQCCTIQSGAARTLHGGPTAELARCTAWTCN